MTAHLETEMTETNEVPTNGNGKRRGRPPGPAKAKAGRPKSAEEVQIPELRLSTVEMLLVGSTSLIMHKFAEKSRTQMADKQGGKPRHKKEARDPQADFEASIYCLPSSTAKKPRYGFPASAFKQAAVSACRFVDGVSMSYAQGAFHILGDLVEILSDKPIMRTDTVRIGGFGKKVADLRYRPEFQNWRCKLQIRYNSSAINPSQIANLLNVAGFSVGVGEWRPEKRGSFGMFGVG